MRLSTKLLIILLLLALASLSCKAVSGLGQEITPDPANSEPADPGALVFKPEQLPDAQVGKEYRVRVTVENTRTPVGAFSLQDGQLPPGLSLEKEKGETSAAVISGTSSQAGTYQFVVYVWCYGTQRSGQTGQKEYTIVVK